MTMPDSSVVICANTSTRRCQTTAATIMILASSTLMPERVMMTEPTKAPTATLATR